jgi:DNA-binding CsgD family transcriptional regulator/tetratricopeptide (TPR) repeat protein
MQEIRDLASLDEAIAEVRATEGERAVLGLIARHWPAVSTTDGARLRALIESVDHNEWDDDPWIIAAMGASYRSLGTKSRSAALPWFHAAQSLLDADPDASVATRANVGVHHAAALRSVGRFEDALRVALAARELLDADLTMRPALRVRAQAKVALQIGLLELHLGRYDTALVDLRLAYGLESELTRSELVELLAGIALQRYAVGEFPTALEYAARTRAAAGDSGLLISRFGAPALITELLVADDQGRAADAIALQPVVRAAARNSDWTAHAHYAIGCTAEITGRHIEGLDELAKAIDAARDWQGEPVVRTISEGMRAVLFMHLGDTREALSIFGRLTPTENHADCPGRYIASIRLAADDVEGTLTALEGCEALGEGHSNRTMIDVLILRAAANYELGATVAADVAFDRALLYASHSSMRTPFLLVPAPTMARMLSRAADRNQPEAVHGILTELHASTEAPPVRAASVEALDALSQRERDIARQLSLDKTINQIAAELFISANTVKTHVRSIYRKLDATNRTDAMRRVRELGLDL